MNILRVIANPKPTEQSASRKVEQAFTSALQAKYPDAKITTLDVYADEVPLLDDKLLPVFFGVSRPMTKPRAVEPANWKSSNCFWRRTWL